MALQETAVAPKSPSRAIVNMSRKQYVTLKEAGEKLGLTVPRYILVKALEAATD